MMFNDDNSQNDKIITLTQENIVLTSFIDKKVTDELNQFFDYLGIEVSDDKNHEDRFILSINKYISLISDNKNDQKPDSYKYLVLNLIDYVKSEYQQIDPNLMISFINTCYMEEDKQEIKTKIFDIIKYFIYIDQDLFDKIIQTKKLYEFLLEKFNDKTNIIMIKTLTNSIFFTFEEYYCETIIKSKLYFVEFQDECSGIILNIIRLSGDKYINLLQENDFLEILKNYKNYNILTEISIYDNDILRYLLTEIQTSINIIDMCFTCKILRNSIVCKLDFDHNLFLSHTKELLINGTISDKILVLTYISTMIESDWINTDMYISTFGFDILFDALIVLKDNHFFLYFLRTIVLFFRFNESIFKEKFIESLIHSDLYEIVINLDTKSSEFDLTVKSMEIILQN